MTTQARAAAATENYYLLKKGFFRQLQACSQL